MTIRILCYNIHGGTGRDGIHDYRRIHSLLREQKIDIALLQEVDTRPVARKTAPDFAHLCSDYFPYFSEGVSVKEADGWYGNAILSRFRIIDSQTVDITFDGWEPRNIMEAIIDAPGHPIRVLNTHKGLNHRERRHQLQKLYHLLDRHNALPLFVGGDINEWHTSSKAMRELNEALCPIRVGRTFPTYIPIFHLDRIWCRPAYIVKEARVLKTKETRFYSDHFPVLAELEIGSMPKV